MLFGLLIKKSKGNINMLTSMLIIWIGAKLNQLRVSYKLKKNKKN